MTARKKTSLGASAVTLTASKVLTMVISLVISMLLARFRTLKEYGTYSQMLLSISLASTLLMLGLPNSVNFFLSRAETDEERRRFLSVYYTLMSILGLIVGTVLVLSIPLIEGYFKNPLIHSFFYFLALTPWTGMVSGSLENVLVVYDKTRFLMAFRLISVSLQLGIILAVQLLGLGFREYLISEVGLDCMVAVSVYYISGQQCGGLSLSLDKKLIRSILVFSVPIGLAAIVGTINTEIDKLLIGYLMDTEQMAIYTNAAKELPLSVISTSLTAVLLPKLTLMIKKGRNTGAVELWGHATELAFIIIAFIAFGVFTYAEDTMTFLYSAKYITGVNVFRVYTLVLLLRCTYFGIILNAVGHTKKILYCSLASLVLNIVLNPLMYFLMGMIGPAIATFIAIGTIQFLQLKMSANSLGIGLSRIFPWKQLTMILLINAAFSCVFWAIKHIIPLDKLIGSIPESIFLGMIWAASYFFIVKKQLIYNWHELNSKDEIDERTNDQIMSNNH